MIDLKAIYLDALASCSPARLAALAIDDSLPRRVVAIGKCAGPLFDGVASRMRIDEALVIVPAGYPGPRSALRRKRVLHGGHPDMTAESFAAGRELLKFAGDSDDLLVLVSGGASACVEAPLAPWFDEHDLSAMNRLLVDSGLPIGQMNVVRKHLSAVKGGRLAEAVRGRTVTLVYSDVATGCLADVGSGPSLPDTSTKAEAFAIARAAGAPRKILEALSDAGLPDTPKTLTRSESRLIADNDTLVTAAADVARAAGWTVERWDGQLEGDVREAAARLVERAAALPAGTLLAAGGEVTVVRRQPGGRGGRCTELAAHVLVASQERGMSRVSALFGSSDGVDGSSPAAAILIDVPGKLVSTAPLIDAISRSDTFSAVEQLSEPIIIRPTGNNLRDLVLLARR